jgi:hypothetical protein
MKIWSGGQAIFTKFWRKKTGAFLENQCYGGHFWHEQPVFCAKNANFFSLSFPPCCKQTVVVKFEIITELNQGEKLCPICR